MAISYSIVINEVSEFIRYEKDPRELLIDFDKYLLSENSNLKLETEALIGELLIDYIETDISNLEQCKSYVMNYKYNPDVDLKNVSLNWSEYFDNHLPKHIFFNSIKSLAASILYNYFFNNSDLSIEGFLKLADALAAHIDNIIYTINTFKDAMIFCFDVFPPDNMSDLTAMQKYYIYINCINLVFKNREIKMIIEPTSKSDEFPPYYSHSADIAIIIESLKASKIVVENKCILAEDHFSICHYLLLQFLQKDLKIKKCSHCGKYYTIRNGYNSSYCNRVPEGEKKSCKEIGAERKYIEKIQNDPILKDYRCAYKTHHARLRIGKITQAEFNKWYNDAEEIKEKVLKNEISYEEYKTWLKK